MILDYAKDLAADFGGNIEITKIITPVLIITKLNLHRANDRCGSDNRSGVL
jgi:hypothetical protein